METRFVISDPDFYTEIAADGTNYYGLFNKATAASAIF
jgi:hypothetical protein